MSKWWQYIINPIGSLASDVVHSLQKQAESHLPYTENGEPVETVNPNMVNNKTTVRSDLIDLGKQISGLWDDLTGKSNIELQNKLNREMAEEEYQRNLQAIGDTASAYEAAGFNRNLMYGSASQASYSAPQLQAYSGSAKLDTIMNRVGKLVGMIPAFYQASAALEGIDQARERTKQSEIKTMSMGMSLLDQGYKLGDIALSHPFGFDIDPREFSDKRHYLGANSYQAYPGAKYDNAGGTQFYKYADAALKNKFDLLKSIGIKNEMNSTLNSWRGYQYDLDRRFGAIGRVVGMASQGAGAIGKLVTPNMLKFGFK